MWVLLQNAIVALAGSFGIKILLALGISITGYVGMGAIADSIVSMAQGYMGGMTGNVAAIVQLGGFGEAVGIILGGAVTKAAIKAASLFASRIA